jgi:hypothetical protein
VLDVETDAMRLEEVSHQAAQLVVIVDEQDGELNRSGGRRGKEGYRL